MSILKLQNVLKKFGDYAAVNDVTFEVESGRIFGMLGPNGAGKTTTIRMITNIYLPDNGKIFLFGEDVDPRHQNRIGYMPEERGLYKKIKVHEQLIYFGELKGMSRNDASSKAKEWLRKLDAADWANKKIQELSKGMQQKVQFISTILHEPEILILDEPFSGLDPINVEVLKRVIMDMKEEGKTIILSTHVMEQVEQICDDICLINKGKIVINGKVRDIKKSYGRDTVIIEFEGDDSFLEELHNVKFINRTKNRAEFRFMNSGIDLRAFLNSALSKSEINKFEIVEPSINEIFIDVVSKTGNG